MRAKKIEFNPNKRITRIKRRRFRNAALSKKTAKEIIDALALDTPEKDLSTLYKKELEDEKKYLLEKVSVPEWNDGERIKAYVDVYLGDPGTVWFETDGEYKLLSHFVGLGGCVFDATRNDWPTGLRDYWPGACSGLLKRDKKRLEEGAFCEAKYLEGVSILAENLWQRFAWPRENGFEMCRVFRVRNGTLQSMEGFFEQAGDRYGNYRYRYYEYINEKFWDERWDIK